MSAPPSATGDAIEYEVVEVVDRHDANDQQCRVDLGVPQSWDIFRKPRRVGVDGDD
jgi:hypothetical protein